jgi:hypothetical protein
MCNKLGAKKRREICHQRLTSDANDSWARVELYRWQHGHLPSGDEQKPLDISEGLMKMSEALIAGNSNAEIPTPFNVSSVLAYISKEINNLKVSQETPQNGL